MFRFSSNIALHVSRRDEAAAFYESTFGFKAVPGPGDCGVEMKVGSMTFWVDQSPSPEKNGEVFFEFLVDDLAKAREILIKKGCTALYVTSNGDHTGEMFADPFGLKFHLYLMKEKT